MAAVIEPLWEIDFPHSLGLLYSAFTYFTGFRVNSGEYKLMGLAPYGEPKYVDTILEHLLDLKEDGTFRLDMSYFNYCTGLTMTNDKFRKSVRRTGPQIGDGHCAARDGSCGVDPGRDRGSRDAPCTHAASETGEENLCLAGGVALNCVSNGKLIRNGPFKNVWVQPAAGDAGGAAGAAAVVWYDHDGGEAEGQRHRPDERFLSGSAIRAG